MENQIGLAKNAISDRRYKIGGKALADVVERARTLTAQAKSLKALLVVYSDAYKELVDFSVTQYRWLNEHSGISKPQDISALKQHALHELWQLKVQGGERIDAMALEFGVPEKYIQDAFKLLLDALYDHEVSDFDLALRTARAEFEGAERRRRAARWENLWWMLGGAVVALVGALAAAFLAFHYGWVH